MSDVEIRVVDDPAREVAHLLVEHAWEGAHVALSGGSTPRAALEHAAELEHNWRGTTLWWGDDRCVPPDHEHSNFRLAREALLDRITDRPHVHRIEGELDPEEAAARYDRALEGVTLDIALNGIGPDGHTASLFPNAPGLRERQRRAIAAEPALDPRVPRVTMTPPVFAAAKLLVYLVTGAEKADAVRRAFAEEPSPETPASLIRGVRTLAVLDMAAAAQLDS